MLLSKQKLILDDRGDRVIQKGSIFLAASVLSFVAIPNILLGLAGTTSIMGKTNSIRKTISIRIDIV
jgi:hypothetical protein